MARRSITFHPVNPIHPMNTCQLFVSLLTLAAGALGGAVATQQGAEAPPAVAASAAATPQSQPQPQAQAKDPEPASGNAKAQAKDSPQAAKNEAATAQAPSEPLAAKQTPASKATPAPKTAPVPQAASKPKTKPSAKVAEATKSDKGEIVINGWCYRRDVFDRLVPHHPRTGFPDRITVDGQTAVKAFESRGHPEAPPVYQLPEATKLPSTPADDRAWPFPPPWWQGPRNQTWEFDEGRGRASSSESFRSLPGGGVYEKRSHSEWHRP